MNTLPVQQLNDLIEIAGHIERHWVPGVPYQWARFMLQKISVRLDRLKESQLGYNYQPDAKKLILHAMEAVQDEFGEYCTEEVRESLRIVFLEVKKIESGQKNRRYAQIEEGEEY